MSGNIANTGNLLVTQNTFTGNLNVTTQANVGGVLHVPKSPLINLATQAFTGLTCNVTANAQTNSNLAQTNVMSCTFNEQGMYRLDGMLFYGTTSGAQGSNASVGMNLGFAGTSTVASIKYAVSGRANGTTIFSNLITTTAQTTIITNVAQSIANSTNNSDYLILSGYLNVSAVGTLAIGIASANSLNANLNVSTNSYVVYTKIG